MKGVRNMARDEGGEKGWKWSGALPLKKKSPCPALGKTKAYRK